MPIPLRASPDARRALTAASLSIAALLAACTSRAPGPAAATPDALRVADRLPTGRRLDPIGVSQRVGALPLAMLPAPDGRLLLVLSGWAEQGFDVLERDGTVRQHVVQPAAFVGAAFSPDSTMLYVSGGNQDVVYRYRFADGRAALADSFVLAPKAQKTDGTRYPGGVAVSRDGRRVYVAENLGDSLAVLDAATGAIVQRVPTGRYPYGVAVAPDGTVYVTPWNGHEVRVFRAGADGALTADGQIAAGRHPSALLLNRDGSRLFVASASTDRVSVIDTRARRVIAELLDPPPAGPAEGSTPNGLALSEDGTRLFAAEADANAVAVFDLSAATSGVAGALGGDLLAGRVPTEWYPTAAGLTTSRL